MLKSSFQLNKSFALQAMDEDTTKSITYKIASGNANNHFRIDTRTGLITTNARLDFETRPSYILVVTTVEGESANTPSSSATVNVTVLVSV